ncbi:hypothetical protein Pint_31039 [Pistacia integerrima]|uniref:Uncharacterized protein n=1 Tax=Pistacia integerrima TaxID=434235 RepID=A0ACC0XMN7_9ROSI|nr:hypothetical protein Pint_31039 [Pistacia integerrima]
MATPKEHIEDIRRNNFWIGREEQNRVVLKMLHKTVKLLSAELYAKDNAEDNEYPHEAVDPSLEFVLTSCDITGTGAPATLLVFNNEKGFSAENMESICSAGVPTKEGNRKRGQIGEKGIGFKSVFLITARPYVFSSGYQIRFTEEPCTHCNIAYMEQLLSVHPELMLFLTKIKQLSIREHNENLKLNTVSTIAINSETNFVTRKNIDVESYTLYLSTSGNKFEKGFSYYMWRRKFPFKEENKVKTEGAPISNLPLMFNFLPIKSSSYQELNVVKESIKAKLVEENIIPRSINNEWYAKCIQSSNLVLGVSKDVYLELLIFPADNWSPNLSSTNNRNISLIKYVDLEWNVALCSISSLATSGNKRVVYLSQHLSWLIDWNKEFRFVSFMPKKT